ncbi:AzlC family ABC transporter permease [Bacillus sp. SRB3LM]|uniref:AzlC family ABC transporter permease n=1 Tax=Bacillus sp. SRB3LM TaxID=2608689 RepID=UPI0018C3844E|nr:AzlC family ABC transporter permease [Bacillus sp. SRB3LM]MBG0968535.1 AzlC family ABC transporter permease [Bacillus sp. SRB3LM]
MSKAQAHVALQSDDTFQQGVKDCLPTVFGYLSIGIAAGVIAKTAGFSIIEIAFMSTLIYAGSAQFILAGMYAAGAPASAIIFTVFFVNLRHLLMSAALAPQKGYLGERWMIGLNVTAYLNWILATIIGGLFGEWIPDPHTYGMDYALPAMFIGLFVLQLISSKPKLAIHLSVAIVAIIIAYVSHLFMPDSIAVIIATLLAATIGVVIEKWK